MEGGGGMGMLQLQCVFDGSISGHHSEIERRPYHRNCGCALHSKSSGLQRRHSSATLCSASAVSFPIQRSPSQGSLTLAAATHSPASSSSTTTSSPPFIWDLDFHS